MADVPIPFGPWEPDKAPHMSPALADAVNVLPVAGAYAPFAAHVPDATLPGPAYGFHAVPLADGSPLVHVATADAIWRMRRGGMTQAYSLPGLAPAPWSFTSFGGRVIAVNPGVDPLGALPGQSFAALGGNPSPAHVAAVVEKNFLVLGNLADDGVDGAVPNRVRWSGFLNPDTWGTNVGTQADFEDMPDEGGPVVAITGRETGTIFQRKAIVRMQYQGGSAVFAFATVEQGRGAVSTGAVIDIGNVVFFVADDGFFAWDGTQAIPIGSGKVDRWFHERVNHNRLDSIVGGFDPVSRCVIWGFPEAEQSAPTAMVAYSLTDQRWTRIDMAVQQLGASAVLPATLESMSAPDLFVGSFDDPAYAGGRPYLAAVDASNRYGLFAGAAMAATIETGDWQSKAGLRSVVQGVRPMVDSDGASVAVASRSQSLADPLAWRSATSRGVDGMCPQRVDARHLRYRQSIPANDDWSRATGLEVRMMAGGRR